MYYFPKHKLGFLHIPKTGGSAFSRFLIQALHARGDEAREVQKVRWHEPLADKIEVLGADIARDSLFLATVRNPYAAAVSLYFWCRKKVDEKHFDLHEYPSTELIARMTFAQYMAWYVDNELPFERYFLDDDGRVPGNLRLLRLEAIDAEADAVLNGELGLGMDVHVPVGNASVHGPALSYLDDDQVRLLNAHQAWLFAHCYRAERIEPAPAPRAGTR